MKTKNTLKNMAKQAALTLLLAMSTCPALATNFIKDVMLLGSNNQAYIIVQKQNLKQQGWTCIEQDLNAGAGGDFIYLFYKSENNNVNLGYITGFFISGSYSSSLTYQGRTYYPVACQGSSDFTGSHGDLNNNAGGDYIFLYYTKDLFPDNRTVTSIYFNSTQSGALGLLGINIGYDLNHGAGGDYIYMHCNTATAVPAFSGTGTDANPFLIGSATDWANFATLSSSIQSYTDKCYKLTANISVSEMVGTSSLPFRGTFDGNGHSLNASISGTATYTAPFRYVNGATIRDLTVNGSIASSGNNAGGLVGRCAGTTTITGCVVAASISGFSDYAGGLIGWCVTSTLNMNNNLFKGSFTPSGEGKYHPVACKNPSANVTASITTTYYLNTVMPTATGNYIINDAGTPVSTTYGQPWIAPVTAADGVEYYASPAVITIGHEEYHDNSMPFYPGYSLTQQIYTAEEIGMAGSITSISFNHASSNLDWEGIQVYLKHTEKNVFENNTDIVMMSESDRVFNGTYHISGDTWSDIVFDTPFEYDGNSNLVVCCYIPVKTNTTSVLFTYHYLSDQFKSIYCYDNDNPIPLNDITNCPNPHWTHSRNNIQLSIIPDPYPKPADLALVTCTNTMASLVWAAPETSYTLTGYAYQYKKYTDTSWSGETTVSTTTTSATISELLTDTEYVFRVKALYGDHASSYKTLRFITAKPLPYTCGFENGTDGWSFVDIYWNASGLSQYAAHEGGYGFTFGNFDEGTHGPQYLISPRLPNNVPLKTSFYYRGRTSYNQFIKLGYSTTSSDPATFTWVDVITPTNNQWKWYERNLPEGAMFVALSFDYVSQDKAYVVDLDDFVFDALYNYGQPKNLAASNLTNQSATLSWTAPNTSVTGYAYQYSVATDETWSSIETVNNTSVTLNGLSPNTSYKFRVKALYGENASNFVNISFITEGGIEPLPHFQGFEDGMGGWRVVNGYSTTGIRSSGHSGEKEFNFYGSASTPIQYLISPQFDASTAIMVSFYYKGYTDGTYNYTADFQVGYSTTTKDLDNFVWGPTISSGTAWNSYMAYAVAGTKYVAIKWIEGFSLHLDDFSFLPANVLNVTGYGESTESDHWKFIASPVAQSLAPTEVYNLLANPANHYDLYRFNQNAAAEWENYKAHTEGFVLENGKGYLYANKDSRDLVFVGVMNDNNEVAVSLDYNANAVFKGWNLVGNPFPVPAVVNKSYYTMNDDGTGLVPQPASAGGTIAACTGIMVQAEGPNESVTFSRPTRQNTKCSGMITIEVGPSTLRQTQGSETLTLDMAIVSFTSGDQLGKYYFGQQNANLYFTQNQTEYAIVYSEPQDELPLNFVAQKDGEYTLMVQPQSVDLAYLHLIDNLTSTDIDLLNPGLNPQSPATSYTFSAKTSDNASRFCLKFNASSETDEETFAYFNGSEWVINTTGEASLQLIDMMGHTVSTYQLNGTQSVSTAALTSGTYVMRLVEGTNIKTQKIVVEN